MRPLRGFAWRLGKSLILLIVTERRLRDGTSADRSGGSGVRRSGLGAQPDAGRAGKDAGPELFIKAGAWRDGMRTSSVI